MENFIFCALMLVFDHLPKTMDASYNQEKEWQVMCVPKVFIVFPSDSLERRYDLKNIKYFTFLTSNTWLNAKKLFTNGYLLLKKNIFCVVLLMDEGNK